MKSSMICGLIALQMAAGITATAQNYYIKISGDRYTRVADHAHWEQSPVNLAESLEAYNLEGRDGSNAIGTMRFQGGTGNMSYATHYHFSNTTTQVVARKIVLHGVDRNAFFVVAEKVKSGTVTSAAVLYYDRVDGSLDKSWELAALPPGYEFLHIFDAMMAPDSRNEMRILCTAKQGSTQGVIELLFNISTGQYKIRRYKPTRLDLDKYNSVHYVRANHYGMGHLGNEISFYGMGISGDKSVAFCYSDNRYEQYSLFSTLGREEVAGVQMNGSYGADGTAHRIDMAFIDAEGSICIQQKDWMGTANWRRFYRLPQSRLQMGMGRDGHGTKSGNDMHYFIATAHLWNSTNLNGEITTLHYNSLNGDMNKPNIWNFSGVGVNKGGGFPNDTNDPTYDYTFIADRYNQSNGFKFGTGITAATDRLPCGELYDLKEDHNVLKELQDIMYIETYDQYTALSLEMKKTTGIRVEVIPECETEQRGAQEHTAILLPGTSTLEMNAEHLRLEATGKTIASLQLLSIDGRMISEARNINSNSFEQRFARTLVPGIYLVNISYADHSKEVRKVSIQSNLR